MYRNEVTCFLRVLRTIRIQDFNAKKENFNTVDRRWYSRLKKYFQNVGYKRKKRKKKKECDFFF